eukprot:m.115525 g.115525  ORF g.115525 m.115525 type:complete len:809 (+) comp16051_c1_seq4:203-2629(+)
MEWNVTYNGSMEVSGLSLDDLGASAKPDLTEETNATAREIRKVKAKSDQLNLSVTPDSLRGVPLDSSASPFYQPIGKIIFVHPHVEGSLKKVHLFSYIAASEDTRLGGPNAKYICHTFKAKNEEEANALAFAAGRTMVTHGSRKKPETIENASPEQTESAIRWWNASNAQLYHYSVGKDGLVAGNMKFLCQVDSSLKTATKVVRLSTSMRGDELILLLAEKFNLGSITPSEYAVFDIRDTGDQLMLDDDTSPIVRSLQWKDPSEGTFWLKKLPQGLVRVPTIKTPRPSTMNTPADTRASISAANGGVHKSNANSSTTAAVTSNNNINNNAHDDSKLNASAAPAAAEGRDSSSSAAAGTGNESADRAASLGPLLPYHPDDEELLLNVMITRQTGSGLGFKLTPAYLLHMCISYCALNFGDQALQNLLKNVASQISAVISDHPSNPDMLLFWAANATKLSTTITKDAQIASVYNETAKPILESAIENALKLLRTCATAGMPMPQPLEKSEWTKVSELRAVITDYYRQLDANMSHESLQDVVARITAAMPNPQKKRSSGDQAKASPAPSADPRRANVPPEVLDSDGAVHAEEWDRFRNQRASNANDMSGTSAKLGFTASPGNAPMTSTPVGKSVIGDSISPGVSAIQDHPNLSNVDTSSLPKTAERPGSPLPEEWEELIDQETQHRFFANHVTRQTSWTDPRDKLQTITLIKGDKGLGLGISGAKRTWDERLILGIFVSSLVPGSAAHQDGNLREGDEILEVNGHSLIGVSREGAIEFLKQVKNGGKVTLLTAQEPLPSDRNQSKLRHTAL